MFPTILLTLLLGSLRCVTSNVAPPDVKIINADFSKKFQNYDDAFRSTDQSIHAHAEGVISKIHNIGRALDEETSEPEDTQEPQDTD